MELDGKQKLVLGELNNYKRDMMVMQNCPFRNDPAGDTLEKETGCHRTDTYLCGRNGFRNVSVCILGAARSECRR